MLSFRLDNGRVTSDRNKSGSRALEGLSGARPCWGSPPWDGQHQVHPPRWGRKRSKAKVKGKGSEWGSKDGPRGDRPGVEEALGWGWLGTTGTEDKGAEVAKWPPLHFTPAPSQGKHS